MDADFTAAAVDCARSVFGDVQLIASTTLRDRPGWFVGRVVLMTDNGQRSVIAKVPRPRERAALEVLTDAGVGSVPRLLAAGDNPAVVLMEDVGSGGCVADHLLRADPGKAAAAVVAWAEAIARLQVATLGLGTEFRHRLAASWPDWKQHDAVDLKRHPFGRDLAVAWKVAVTRTDSEQVINETIKGLRTGLAHLGVNVGDRAQEELRAATRRLHVDVASAQGPGALSPCDACPDNNIEAPDGLVLIDFEGAEFRHIAWDAAYLTVPWPTCWCSWRMPDAVTASALAHWREIIEPKLGPEVSAGLDDAIRDATVVWALTTVAWFFDAAHRGDPLGPGGSLRPGARELIQHRLGVVAATDSDGVLGRLAAGALDATRAAWGYRPLPLAPAWR